MLDDGCQPGGSNPNRNAFNAELGRDPSEIRQCLEDIRRRGTKTSKQQLTTGETTDGQRANTRAVGHDDADSSIPELVGIETIWENSAMLELFSEYRSLDRYATVCLTLNQERPEWTDFSNFSNSLQSDLPTFSNFSGHSDSFSDARSGLVTPINSGQSSHDSLNGPWENTLMPYLVDWQHETRELFQDDPQLQ